MLFVVLVTRPFCTCVIVASYVYQIIQFQLFTINTLCSLQALLINRRGAGSLADGPQRVFVVGQSFQRLTRLSADQKEYYGHSDVGEHDAHPDFL